MEKSPAKYPVGFYYELSFKGDDAAFQDVSGISKELQVEEVVCGGENSFKYKLPTIATSQNLVLKRALVPKDSKLMSWCASTLDQGLDKPIEPHDVSLDLLDANNDSCIKWTFHKAYPVKYTISDLKSMGNEIVLETIELAYTYFKISENVTFKGLF